MRKYDHLRNKNGMMETNCEYCAKLIEFKDFRNHKGTPTKPRFCNPECSALSQTKNHKSCKECGKKMRYKETKGGSYCSNKCKDLYRYNKFKKNCTFCGKEFCPPLGSTYRITCSEECNRRQSGYKADKRYWEELDAYRGFCTVCDKELEFKKTQSLQDRKNQKTCSPQCASFARTISTCPELKNVLQEDFYKNLFLKMGNKKRHIGNRLKMKQKYGNYTGDITTDIDIAYLLKIFPKDYRCPILGCKMNFDGNGLKDNSTASLDRIDSNKGYTKGNVEWVSNEGNRLKRNLDLNVCLKLLENFNRYE